MKPLSVLSLGWGMQSWTIAAMVALGDLPPLDAAIHADTGWERAGTYVFAAGMTPWLEERGVRVMVVGEKRDHPDSDDPSPPIDRWGGVTLPVFTTGKGAGGGQLRRQCTGEWKIRPIRRAIRQLMAERGLRRVAGAVHQWLGISLDEIERQRTSDVRYITNVFPLLDLKMTRVACAAYLEAHDLPLPPKSACTFCPYHNAAAWQEMKREDGADWHQAVQVDEAVRKSRPPFDVFVHSSRKPLAEAVIIPEDFGASQPSLLDDHTDPDACASGHCFL